MPLSLTGIDTAGGQVSVEATYTLPEVGGAVGVSVPVEYEVRLDPLAGESFSGASTGGTTFATPGEQINITQTFNIDVSEESGGLVTVNIIEPDTDSESEQVTLQPQTDPSPSPSPDPSPSPSPDPSPTPEPSPGVDRRLLIGGAVGVGAVGLLLMRGGGA